MDVMKWKKTGEHLHPSSPRVPALDGGSAEQSAVVEQEGLFNEDDEVGSDGFDHVECQKIKVCFI